MKEEDKQLVYEIAKEQLNQQFIAIDSFATRAGLVLATCGVILTGYLQLLASDFWLRNCNAWMFIPEILAVLAAAFLAFLSLVPGGETGHWRYDPEPEKLYNLMEKKDGSDIRDEATRSMIESHRHNKKLFDSKFSYLRYSRYALCVSGGVFIIHLLTTFL